MIRQGWIRGRKTRHFTLQWHLTNACRFYCRHCYDRTDRQMLSLKKALEVISDLEHFCKLYRVKPHITFTGGDPLQYSHFWQLYQIAAENQIPVSILGNPISKEVIRQLMAIHPPVSYQVSLEGLRQYNDHIRQEGHFDEVMMFLAQARQAGMQTHVMLTLNSDNIDQVIPLADQLRGLTSRFLFNRLSQVGQAAEMDMPCKEKYAEFLGDYLGACRTNPVLGCKDNLFNIFRHHFRRPYFHGCTGYGCGAAFNFVALLPDGEVHACRKYPSLIGSVLTSTLHEIYHSAAAKEYRIGSQACLKCPIRNHCGGCPAVVYGTGMNPLKDRDPYCFISDKTIFRQSECGIRSQGIELRR